MYFGWTAARHHIAAIDTRGDLMTFTNPSFFPMWTDNQDRTSEGGRRYYLENARALLDAPGERRCPHRRAHTACASLCLDLY